MSIAPPVQAESPKLTIGSLFSGIGGLELGLERTGGFITKWQVEIDEYARIILEKHWPDVQRYKDIRTVRGSDIAHVDLLCGGFPCQDISDAGKRAGLEGERSGLWSEFHRLICELRPRYVLVENVAALLKRGFGTVLADLAEAGYAAEWQVLPAAAFGAPHLRERLFIVAYHDSLHAQHQVFTGSPRIAPSAGFEQWKYCANQLVPIALDERPDAYAELRRSLYGIPHGMDRLRALGNAVVPQVAEYLGRCILAHYAKSQEFSLIAS